MNRMEELQMVSKAQEQYEIGKRDEIINEIMVQYEHDVRDSKYDRSYMHQQKMRLLSC